MKIKDKILKAVIKEKKSISEDFAMASVNLTVKKDLFNRSRKNRKVIIDKYPYFLNNYVKMCNYVLKDFGIKKYQDINFIEEVKLKKQVKKILKEVEPTKLNVISRFGVNKTIKRWWILSNILKFYKTVTELLKNKSNSNIYKDLDLDNEIKQYERYKYLIEDFSVYN